MPQRRLSLGCTPQQRLPLGCTTATLEHAARYADIVDRVDKHFDAEVKPSLRPVPLLPGIEEALFVLSPDPVDVDTFRSAMGYTPRVLTVETVALLMRLHCLLLKRVGVAQMDQRLVAVQYTSMCAGQQRGKHFDKHDQGDIILTLTLAGSCCVRLYTRRGCMAHSFTQQKGAFYALSGACVGHHPKFMHGLRAHVACRRSVTFRSRIDRGR